MNQFIRNAALGRSSFWFFVLTTGSVCLAYVAGQLLLAYVINTLLDIGKITYVQVLDFYELLDPTILGIHPALGLILIFGGHIAAFLIFILALKFLHHRRLSSTIIADTGIRYGRIFFGFGLWWGLMALAELFMYSLNPSAYTFQYHAHSWWVLALSAIGIVPIQSSFEEVFMRGYLLQAISHRYSNIAGVLVTSLIFAVLHMTNPEVANFGVSFMAVYYISVAIFLATITLLDNGLELALGVHAATNIHAIIFVSIEGSVLSTKALLSVSEISPWWMIFLFYAMIAVFCILARSRYEWGIKQVKHEEFDQSA